MGMQQPHYSQQHAGGWGAGNSMLPPPLNPGAPADPETLRRLKDELLQQKQQTAPGRFTAAGGSGGGAAAGGAGKAAAAAGSSSKKVVVREAAGQRWVDPTLAEWPDNDFRIFVGDLGNEVNDEALSKAFSRYPSFAKAKVGGCWVAVGGWLRMGECVELLNTATCKHTVHVWASVSIGLECLGPGFHTFVLWDWVPTHTCHV
jgi:hypothetical protein